MVEQFEFVSHMKEIPIHCFIAGIEYFPPHFHYDIEIIFVLDGEIELTMGQKVYNLDVGDIILINSQTSHSFKWTAGNNALLFLQMDPIIFQSVEKRSEIYTFSCNTASGDGKEKSFIDLRRSLSRIGWEIYNHDKGFRYYIKSEIFNIIGLLIRNFETASENRSLIRKDDIDRIKKIVNYVEMNYTSKIQLDDISNHVNLSTHRFSHYFREKMGMTFQKYLSHIRVGHAKEMLTGTNNTILEISMECGFGSTSGLHRQFNQIISLSPGDFRKLHKPKTGIIEEQGSYTSFNMDYAYELLKDYL